MIEAVAVLLLLLINLLFTCILISVLYFLAIEPLRKRVESQRVVPSQGYSPQEKQNAIPFIRKPEGVLPSMDEVPEEALYGDQDEDIKTKYPTMEAVEDSMTSNDVYSRVDLETENAWEQLTNLKSNAEVRS